MNLHILECLQYYLIIFRKYLFMTTFRGKCNQKTNALNFATLYNNLNPDINWCPSTFDVTRLKGGIVI